MSKSKRLTVFSFVFSLIFLISLGGLFSFDSVAKNESTTEVKEVSVRVVTTLGEFTIALDNRTPQHGENFIRRVEKGLYDNAVFQRAIPDFIVQAGDLQHDSTFEDMLLSIANDSQIPPEIHKDLFHKRGAVSMARLDDPSLFSSEVDFVVNIGKQHTDQELERYESRINDQLKFYYWLNLPDNLPILENFRQASKVGTRNQEAISDITLQFESDRDKLSDYKPYSIPSSHREIYRTIGGNPFSDRRYTVFGEVTDGMDVVIAISNVPTRERDWPIEDIKILSMKLLQE